jgi:hypothetical protein
MTDEIKLPTTEALSDFGLTRTPTQVDAKNNPFIKAPNTNPSSPASDAFLNEVVLHAFNYQPVKVTTDNSGPIPKVKLDYGGGSGPSKFEGKFRILLKNQPTIEGKHTWNPGGKGPLDFFYNAINKAPETIAVYGALAQNAVTYFKGGDDFAVPSTRRTDYQYTYADTEYQTVTINFELFTNNNFLRDIYKPIMGLVSLTYPKRYSNTEGGSIIEEGTAALGEAAQAVTEQGSLTARQYTLKPPCLFNIYHQSGLYSYTNCHCMGFTVTYDGPWYNATASETSQFNILRGSEPSAKIETRAFPSVAKVSMSFRSGERMFKDDFEKIYNSFNSIMSSSQTTYSQFES